MWSLGCVPETLILTLTCQEVAGRPVSPSLTPQAIECGMCASQGGGLA